MAETYISLERKTNADCDKRNAGETYSVLSTCRLGRHIRLDIRRNKYCIELVFQEYAYEGRLMLLVLNLKEIDLAVSDHKDGRQIHFELHLGGNQYMHVKSGFPVVDLRHVHIPIDSTALHPTKTGIALNFAEFDKLTSLIPEIEQLLPEVATIQPCYMEPDHANLLGALYCAECIPNGNGRRKTVFLAITSLAVIGYITLSRSLSPATLTSSIRNTSLLKAANTTRQRSSADLHNTSKATNATIIRPMLPLSIPNESLEKHTIDNVTEFKGGNSNRTELENGQFACPWYNGRLGNLMFQYASVYGLTNQKGEDKPHNMSIILPKNNVLYKTFELPSTVIVDNFAICKTFVVIVEKKCCSFDKRLTNLIKGVNYRLWKYLQSWKYFMHVSEGVRKEFAFRPSVKEKAVDFVEKLRTINSNRSVSVTVVGIHIRRGDIMKENHVRLGFQIASEKYIHNAVDYFIYKYKDVVFVACSDDANYSKEVLNYTHISVRFSSYSAVEDFAILSSCDHVIMTVGTFGWWAAFLSGGTVVYFKHPYKADTHVGRSYTFEDLYPPSWIGME